MSDLDNLLVNLKSKKRVKRKKKKVFKKEKEKLFNSINNMTKKLK